MSNRHVSVRLNAEKIDRVDALIPYLSTKYKGIKRSDVLRALIDDALPRFETEASQKRGEADVASPIAGTTDPNGSNGPATPALPELVELVKLLKQLDPVKLRELLSLVGAGAS